MRALWRWFWTGKPRAVNDNRPWHLLYRKRGIYWSWNEGGRFLSMCKWKFGPLRVYVAKTVIYFDRHQSVWVVPQMKDQGFAIQKPEEASRDDR